MWLRTELALAVHATLIRRPGTCPTHVAAGIGRTIRGLPDDVNGRIGLSGPDMDHLAGRLLRLVARGAASVDLPGDKTIDKPAPQYLSTEFRREHALGARFRRSI